MDVIGGSHPRRGPRPRLVGRTLAVLFLATATALGGGPWRGAGADTTLDGFLATASAQGGRASFSVPGFIVVDEFADAGGPLSQSTVDALGALSFASMPYPGDLVISGPGLFAGFTGHSLPGGYPFYVSASHPVSPEQAFADPAGAYQLWAKAAAGAASSAAKAQGRAGEGTSGAASGAQATTSVLVEHNKVTVTADTVNEGLDFGGGALRIASVRSRSVTTYTAGQPQAVTQTELLVDGGSAGGFRFGFGPGGLVVAGQGVPIPSGNALDQLNAALAPSGISLRFVGARPVTGGGSADALDISVAGQSPVPAVPAGIIRFRLGGATSAVVVGEGVGGVVPPIDAVGGADETVAPPGSDGTSTGSPDGILPSGAVPPSQRGDGLAISDRLGDVAARAGLAGPAGFIGAPPAVSADTTTSASSDGPGAGSEGAAALAQPALQPRELGSDGLIYGVIIGAGVLMLAISALWRGKGVLSV